MKYIKELKVLRQTFPIPLKQGLDLLKKTKGNVEEAKYLFKESVTDTFLQQTVISPEQAYVILKDTNFDIQKALKIAFKKHYSTTEIILQKKSKPKDKVWNIVTCIELSNNLNRTYFHWFDIKDFEPLIPVQRQFMIVAEWLIYVHCESFDYGLGSKKMFEVCEYISSIFKMPDLANTILQADKIQGNYLMPVNDEIKDDFSKYIATKNRIHSDKKYQSCETYFYENEDMLYERMIDFAKNNIAEFP